MRLGALSRLASLSPIGLVNPSSPAVAIDFGTSSLKVLQVTSGEPPALMAAACLPTPDDLLAHPGKRLEFQCAALGKLIRAGGFKGKRAVCAIPATHTVVRHIQVHKPEGASIAAPVAAAAPAQLGVSADQYHFRHIEVGPVGAAGAAGKTEVIALAVPCELIERLMGAVKAARLEPVGMHCEQVALLRAFDAITRRSEDDRSVTLYLDMGCGATRVVIARGRDMVFARRIDVGGRHLDEAICRQLKCDVDGARRLRLADGAMFAPTRRAEAECRAPVPLLVGAGAPREERRVSPCPPGFVPDVESGPAVSPAAPPADLSEPLSILADEAQMCLRHYESMFPGTRVDRAVLVGGEARHAGLCRWMARALRVPAQVGDPLARVARSGTEPALGVDVKAMQPGWAVAVGLSACPTDL